MLWLCSLVMVAAPAYAGDTWTLGVSVGGGVDAGPVQEGEGTAFRPGPVLVVPLRWQPRPGVGLRASLELATAGGQDKVVWSETAGSSTQAYFSDQHEARYAAERLVIGPEVTLLPELLVSPYLGAGGGGGAVQTWHTFEGDTALLSAGGRPSTSQAALAAAGWLGLHVGRPDGVALEIEAGYCVSFLPEAPLHGAPAALDATRTAWSLDLGHLGVGLSFPL